MRVHVLYFGVLKDVIGHRDAVMDVPEGASVNDLLALHRKAGVAVWDSIAVAVNQEYARADDVLKDGDEVALLPPVSGGVDVLAMHREVTWIGEHAPGGSGPVFVGEIEATTKATADPLRG